uniref:Uncharacterized protein n=1 Tax=Schizaphis graminum TaxID=13262 RepID=A0A2S2NLI6_SCHGA
MCILCTCRRTTNDFSSVSATNFKLLAVLRATAADRSSAAAVAGRALPAAYSLLAIPITTYIASAPTARTTYYAGYATSDATPAARGHVQSHTLSVRVEHRLHATESSILHNERRSDGYALSCGLTRHETTVSGNRRAIYTTSLTLMTGLRTHHLIPSHNKRIFCKVQTAVYLTCL